MSEQCPQNLRQAVMHFAQSVRLVREMAESEEVNFLCDYHVGSYLQDMENMLVEQVLTAFPSDEQREVVLKSAGMGYLTVNMRAREKKWERMRLPGEILP